MSVPGHWRKSVGTKGKVRFTAPGRSPSGVRYGPRDGLRDLSHLQGRPKAYPATIHPQSMQLIVRWGIRVIHSGFDALFLQTSIFRRSVEIEPDKRRQHKGDEKNSAPRQYCRCSVFG
jgi:hypothetical protein